MLVAKPAPEDKIRELASAINRVRPEISVDSFLLPRNQNCNILWNTVSTRNVALLLAWYLDLLEASRKDQRSQESALAELLDGIVGSPEHIVIVQGESVPVSIDHLRRIDNWISNHTAVTVLQSVSKHLGREYSDLETAAGAHNPWTDIARFALGRTTEAMGVAHQVQTLAGGPQGAYLNIPVSAAFMNRTTIYEVVGDLRIGARRRRIKYLLHHTNYYHLSAEIVGWNTAVYSVIPQLFSQHPALQRFPGFDLGPADVEIDFPHGDYSGTWEITIDYDITPIDRLRSWFNVGELQETVATLSAEVLELQRDRKALAEEAEHLAGQLVEEEKARRVYQVRAAQADAVARFLHQTSNLVLQPLASTMIVFEDLMEIADDCRSEWGAAHQDDELLRELDDGLVRVRETYPTASRVIDGYRELFHAFYEVYVSTQSERDVNQDLRYIQTLVRNKYILTQVELELELDPNVPAMRLEGGMQSIFLELMQNAAKHGARRLMVRTVLNPESEELHLYFYNNGQPIPQEQWDRVLNHGVSKEGQGFGLADARYIVEALNGGRLQLVPSDRAGFPVLFVIDLPVVARESLLDQERMET